MFTWILIAIAIAAIFGIINIEQIKNQALELYHKFQPHLQNILNKIKEKK